MSSTTDTVIRVTQKGQATIPKALREEMDIDAPGRVIMKAVDGGVLIEPVPTPDTLTGVLSGMTDEEGRTPTEHLRASRRRDAVAESAHRSADE